MTMPIAVLAILFVAGALLGVVSRWLIVCLCEIALLIGALFLALFLHKSLLVTLAILAAGFVAMQIAYILSGIAAEACRHVLHLLRGRPVDKLN